MATANEIAVFEHFRFRVGQKVKTKLAGYSSGFIHERVLTEASDGVARHYLVRHSEDRYRKYREFELEESV